MSQINWLKASLKGRLGEVVGSSWRGKPYTKIYVPPTDPKTTGQTDVRGIFQHVGHLAHLIYHDVLEPYTYPVPHEYTKYNRMMQINSQLYQDKVYNPAKVQILRGELPTAHLDIADYYPPTGEVYAGWVDTAHGDMTDIAIAVWYAEQSDSVAITITDRLAEGADGILPEGLSGAIHCYLAFARPPRDASDKGANSDTVYISVSELQTAPAPERKGKTAKTPENKPAKAS